MDDPFRKLAADKLARTVCDLIDRRVIDSRSRAGDALLDYLNVGGLYGPKSVPEWVEQYDRDVSNPDST